MVKVILQCLLVLVMPILGMIYLLQDALYAVLAFSGIEGSRIETILTSLPLNERGLSIVSGLIISLIILWALRKSNKEKVFNTGDNYGKYPYALYYIASKILGYGFVTLVRVPIYLQFRLVIEDLFDNVKVDENTREEPQPITVTKKNMEQNSDEINLILNDTYPILEEQIPLAKRTLPTVEITNGIESSGIRTYNIQFIDEVRKQTNELRHSYSKINVFATTNTKHNKAIIEDCFKNGRRTGFKELTVFQSNNVNYFFDESYHILKS